MANNVQIAEMYRVPLNDVFDMKLLECFNALTYIKAREDWERKQREDAERTAKRY
jgi:hypothetical protein